MGRRAAVGFGVGLLLAAVLLGSVWVSAPLAGSGMTEIAEMKTTCTFSVPGKVGYDNITFDATNVTVHSFKLVTDVIQIDGKDFDVSKYAENFVHAVESGGANFRCVIYVDPKSLPAKEDMWVPAEIKGDFRMSDFSCDFNFSTVVHLKTDFSASMFSCTVEDNDKSGVGDEEGTLSNVSCPDEAVKRMVYQVMAVNGGAVSESFKSSATLTSWTTMYFVE